MKSILDPRFKYTPSHSTDIRKTFQRLRREQQQQTPPAPNVTPLKVKK